MDNNGQPNQTPMNLNAFNPNSNTPKEMLDEPTVPRRNSTDDTDTTRPRKRPAVMVGGEESRDSNMSSEDPKSDFATERIIIPQVDANNEETSQSLNQKKTMGKTIHLRTSQSLDENSEVNSTSPSSVTLDENTTNASPSELGHFDTPKSHVSQHDRRSVCSSSSEVEEIDVGDIEEINEIVEFDHYEEFVEESYDTDGTAKENTTYLEAVDRLVDILGAPGDDKISLLETITHELNTGLSPLQQLKGLGEALTKVVLCYHRDASYFESKYLYDRVLCDEIPSIVTSLLKRTRPFGDEFFIPENGLDGIQSIVRLFAVVVGLLGLFIELDIAYLENSTGEDRDLYSLVSLSIIPSMLKHNRLYELIANSRSSIYSSFPAVLKSFLEPNGFLENLDSFSSLLIEKVSVKSGFIRIGTQLNILSTALLRSLHISEKEGFSTEICSEIQFTVPMHLSKYFVVMENHMNKILDSHIQALDLKDFLEYLDSMIEVGRYLYSRVPLDVQLRNRLRLFIEQLPADSGQREIALLSEATLRFPTYFKMLGCSRMDFRLRGLNSMTDCLLNYWRGNTHEDWRDSPILRYIVDFLLVNKVVEYLVGSESHYELIRRCSNVPSFLLVSGSITAEILDALWQPVLDNRDPRIVQATLHMHGEMSANMGPEHIIMLCERITSISFPSFDCSVMELVGQLIDKIRGIYEAGHWEDSTILAPYKMLIRLMRLECDHLGSVTTTSHLFTSNVFDLANRQLSRLAETGPGISIRKQIFNDCVADIRDMTGGTTGSTTAILTILRRRSRASISDAPTTPEDIHILVDDLKLPSLLVKEISKFVDIHRNGDTNLRAIKLDSRLELLKYILHYYPQCLQKEEHAQLWLYIVGEKALGTIERDRGFGFYNYFVSKPGFQSVLNIIYCELFPKLNPQCFSPDILSFCKNSLQYLNGTDRDYDASVVQINGIDQLWRIMLNASDEKLVSNVVELFVWVYLESSWILQASSCAVQATHFSIVNRCINQLTLSARYVNDNNDSRLKQTAIDYNSDDTKQATREYLRSLQILECLVRGLRSNPRYLPRRALSDICPRGDSLILRLRCNSNGTNLPENTLEMGMDNTAGDLLFKISSILSSGKNRVMLSGRELKLGEDTNKTLRQLGFSNDRVLTIYNIQDSQTEQVIGEYSSDVVQDEIMRHFEALYSLLDLPEPYSLKAWGFLRHFPVNALIKQHVVEPELSWEDLYPYKKPFKCLYSLYALSRRMNEQKATNNGLTSFMRISIPRLIEALTHSYDEKITEKNRQTWLNLKSELLCCLKVLLQEPVSEETSMVFFSSPELLVKCLLNLLRQCSIPGISDLADVDKCIANAIRVLFISSKINRQVWHTITHNSDWKLLVKEFLVDDPRLYVRQSLSDAITAVCTPSSQPLRQTQDFAQFFWSVLCDIVSPSDKGSLLPENSEQLFHAAISTFKFLGDSEASSLYLPTLFENWVAQICAQPVTEIVGRPQENYVIMGYARLLRLCLRFANCNEHKINTRTIDDLWRKLLFPKLDSSSVKLDRAIPIIHNETRTEIYTLLLEMVETEQDLRVLSRYNYELFQEGLSKFDGQSIDRDRLIVGPTGFSGLINLSNTCYLNSLVTQLFMNCSFRDFVLQLEANEPDNLKSTASCLQALFTRMEDGVAKAADPRDLVNSLRDFAGEPIDATLQMDVDEFFNLLFDRLEGELCDKNMQSLFRSFYGGHLVQQVKSNECIHISERTEAFSAIQCDIKGKSTLQESLKAYVEGEAMEGDNKYRCGTCDRLVDAVKRTCLKDIPDNLILHLKRFDFDLQTMNRSKINDCFEFPTTLNMAPYTMSYLSALESGTDNKDFSPSDDFQLVGVLVHTGTAESGHYYSYIRDRYADGELPSWYEFNDSEVNFFNPATIPASCYGGCDNFSSGSYTINKTYSAYMLFYQRSTCVKNSQITKFRQAVSTNGSPTSNLRFQILRENQDLMKRYCMFGKNYIGFLQGLLNTAYKFFPLESKNTKEIFLLGLWALEQISSKFKDSTEYERLLTSIQKWILESPICCRFFLDWASDDRIIDSLIVSNPFATVRQSFSRMLLAQLENFRVTEPKLYGVVENRDCFTILESQCVLYKICTAYSDAWTGLQYTSKSWNEYFGTLVSICMLGTIECECILGTELLRNILQILISEFYPEEERVHLQIQHFQKILEKPRLPAEKLAKLLTLLMAKTSVFLKPCKDAKVRARIQSRPLPLTIDEHQIVIFSRESQGVVFLSKLIELPGTTNEAGKLIFNIVVNAPDTPRETRYLKTVLRTLTYNVDIDPAAQAEPFLECLKYFISATTSTAFIEEIIKKVAEEIPTIGASGGPEHLVFFQGLAETHDSKNLEIRFMMLKYIYHWAPPLLVYHDEDVRDGAEKLVNLLLSAVSEDPQFTKISFERLSTGCFNFIHEKMPQLRQPPDEQTFSNVLTVLDKCKEWQNDREDYSSRLEDIKNFITRLIFDEEDPDLESDVWECSDVGSDAPVQTSN